MVDGKPMQLERDSGDEIFTGIIYLNSTKLSKGSHDYYFKAGDEFDPAEVMNDTPGEHNPKLIEVEAKQGVDDQSSFKEYFGYILPLIVIIIILIGIGVILSSHHKKRLTAGSQLKPKPKPKLQVVTAPAHEIEIPNLSPGFSPIIV